MPIPLQENTFESSAAYSDVDQGDLTQKPAPSAGDRDSSKDKDSALSAGAIAGIVIGLIALIVIIIVLIRCCKQKSDESSSSSSSSSGISSQSGSS
jgi:hypothetical protein